MSDDVGFGPRTRDPSQTAGGAGTATDDEFPDPLPRRPRRVGAEKRKARRRTRRLQRSLPTVLLVGTLAVAGLTALVFVARAVDRQFDPPEETETEVPVEASNPQRTLVLAKFD